MKFDRTKMIEVLRGVLQRMHYPLEVMLVCVRWYVAYPLSAPAHSVTGQTPPAGRPCNSVCKRE